VFYFSSSSFETFAGNCQGPNRPPDSIVMSFMTIVILRFYLPRQKDEQKSKGSILFPGLYLVADEEC